MTRPARGGDDRVPADGVDVRVVDPETGDDPARRDRRLQVRGYHVMAGYHDDAEATARTIDADGWLHTADLVTLDDTGFLRIVGRLKDMIVTGGVNVYAAEVETALESHPAVGQAAVLGLPDPRWGERVVAVLRPATGAALDPAEVEAFLRERLAPDKVPKQWVVVVGPAGHRLRQGAEVRVAGVPGIAGLIGVPSPYDRTDPQARTRRRRRRRHPPVRCRPCRCPVVVGLGRGGSGHNPDVLIVHPNDGHVMIGGSAGSSGCGGDGGATAAAVSSIDL